MNFVRPFGSPEIENSAEMRVYGDAIPPAEGRENEATANGLGALLSRVLGTSTMEIQNLIVELQNLRKKLQTDGSRIQRDIEQYAALSQAVMQLTKIISESVKKLPD